MGSFVTNDHASLSSFGYHDRKYSSESFLSYDYPRVISSEFSKGILDDDEHGKLGGR
jgi:hypothetical protein